jgi:hypothetical protein
MPPNLVPTEALSQVVFIHDYIQLIFQGEGFSLYSRVALAKQGREILQGSDGFADEITRLIGQRVSAAGATNRSKLEMQFEGGSVVWILHGQENERGQEAFQYSNCDGVIVVEQND